jgi:NAD(P)-dependent dehydrogenase (short-subunit alcohol dehydrogenase family)
MEQIAVVTGADRGLGLALCAELLAGGWRVFGGQYLPDWPALGELQAKFPDRLEIVPLDVGEDASVREAAQVVAARVDHLDLLINNAGVSSRSGMRTIHEGQYYGEMMRMINVNALGALRTVEAFLPLLDRGALKRLGFVSSEAGSIGAAKRTSMFGYCMSKSALNMGVRILFNDLHPQGYTFRVYHPGWMRSYMRGIKSDRGDMEPEKAATYALPFFLQPRADEERLVLVDYRGHEWPW